MGGKKKTTKKTTKKTEPKKVNPWLKAIKDTQKKLGCTYRIAMSEAKKTYKNVTK
jgi:hypothetical protein